MYVNRKAESPTKNVRRISSIKQENNSMEEENERYGRSIQHTKGMPLASKPSYEINRIDKFESTQRPIRISTSSFRAYDNIPSAIAPNLKTTTFRSLITNPRHSIVTIIKNVSTQLQPNEKLERNTLLRKGTEEARNLQPTNVDFQSTTEMVTKFKGSVTSDDREETTPTDTISLETPSITTTELTTAQTIMFKTTNIPSSTDINTMTQLDKIRSMTTEKDEEESIGFQKMETTTDNWVNILTNRNETSTMPATISTTLLTILQSTDGISMPKRNTKKHIQTNKSLDDINSMDYVADASIINVSQKSLGVMSYFSDVKNDRYQDEYKMDQLTLLSIQQLTLNRFTDNEEQIMRSMFRSKWKAVRKEVKDLQHITKEEDRTVLLNILKQ